MRVGLVLAAAVLLLNGCGSPTQDASTDGVAGTWALRRRSVDGGTTFRDYAHRFEFSLNRDGSWSDDDGESGRWRQFGPRLELTYHEPDRAPVTAIARLSDEGRTLTLRFAVGGRVSVYGRAANPDLRATVPHPVEQ